MADLTPYWFRAKRYGWGWSLPVRREGWIVFFIWLVFVILDGILIAPQSLPLFIIILAVLAIALLAICYAKGEPPRWRWGKP
ncbi:MAG TPA: hypothetical protein VGG19_08770 [Tepidisphaeraceae bacterium]|jgi:hypothetical protein